MKAFPILSHEGQCFRHSGQPLSDLTRSGRRLGEERQPIMAPRVGAGGAEGRNTLYDLGDAFLCLALPAQGPAPQDRAPSGALRKPLLIGNRQRCCTVGIG